jgi:glycerophosphoryl diester phosphodiesterase family protein
VKLERTRTLSELLSDSFALYGAHFGRLILAAALVVVPVELVVGGIGLGELTAHFDDHVTQSEQLVEAAAAGLVITPLVTSMVILVLRGSPEPIQGGFEVFAPLVLAVVLTAAATVAGLVLLIVGALWVAVRLVLTTQAVVVDGRRGPDALARSWELTRGSFWRVLGVFVLTVVIAFLVGALISTPFIAVSEAADRQVITLIGRMVVNVLTLPFVAIMLTLLYFDLRERVEPAPAAA